MSTTIPDSHLDLTTAPIGVLATIGADGHPQVSPLWFLYEDGAFKMSLNTSRQKTKNLQANPAANLTIVDPSGYKYLEVRGDVSIDADDDYVFADRVGAKYGGSDLREMDGPGETRVTVTLNATRVNAVAMGS